MKLRHALVALELLFTAGLLAFALDSYFSGTALPKGYFLAFIFYPFSAFAALLMFAYYVSVRFGHNIITYGFFLGLAIGAGIVVARSVPPILTLGLAIYLAPRLAVLFGVKEIGQLRANVVSGDIVSLQLASLAALAVLKEYQAVLGGSAASSLLFGVTIVWYMFNILNDAGTLAGAFGRWSRSESE